MSKFKHTPEEARELWATSLESGKREQATGLLCDDGKYCCLGDLIEVFAENERPLTDSEGRLLIREGDLSCFQDIQEWVGLCNNDARYYGGNDGLVRRNDGILGKEKHTFRQISAIIRSNPQGLFVEETDDTEEN